MAQVQPSPVRVGGFPDAHHVVDGAHVAHVFGEQAAHLLLPPVSCCVQGRPAVDVPAVHVHAALQQHPAPEQARRTGTGGRAG